MQRSGRFGVKHFPRWTHFTPSAVVPGLNGVCGPSLPVAGIAFAGGPRCGPRAIPLRRNAWSAKLAEAVQEARLGQPMWGKAKIAVATRRELQAVGESTIGRVLAHLVRQGSVEPVPALRRNAPRAVRSQRKWARRRPAGLKPAKPGEIVQVDTPAVTPKGRTAARGAAHRGRTRLQMDLREGLQKGDRAERKGLPRKAHPRNALRRRGRPGRRKLR